MTIAAINRIENRPIKKQKNDVVDKNSWSGGLRLVLKITDQSENRKMTCVAEKKRTRKMTFGTKHYCWGIKEPRPLLFLILNLQATRQDQICSRLRPIQWQKTLLSQQREDTVGYKGVKWRYSRGTVRVQWGYSEGTVGVQWGYSGDTLKVIPLSE